MLRSMGSCAGHMSAECAAVTVSSSLLRRVMAGSPAVQEQEEEDVKPAPAAEPAQYDRGKSMRSEDPNFQQKQEERYMARKMGMRAFNKG